MRFRLVHHSQCTFRFRLHADQSGTFPACQSDGTVKKRYFRLTKDLSESSEQCAFKELTLNVEGPGGTTVTTLSTQLRLEAWPWKP